MIKNRIKKTGFTLVETLIAIAILMLAIVGPLTIASNSLTNAYYASDQVTAFYLAQEGIEYSRFLRDYNFINQASGRSWDQGLRDACGGALCRLDSTSIFSGLTTLNAFSVCTSVSDCNIQKDSNGVFRQVVPGSDPTLTPTNFYRTITINPVGGSGAEDQVVVKVSWQTGRLKSPSTFQISENLFNWNSSIGVSSTSSVNLAVSLSGSGSGSVTSNPAGINCGATCSMSVSGGSSVTLTASPSGGSLFGGWSGGGCSGNGTCVVSPIQATTITASFGPAVILTATRTTHGIISSADGYINCPSSGGTCSHTYSGGTSIQISAEGADDTYAFFKWTAGPCNGSSNSSCTFNINSNTTITASYQRIQ